MNKSLLNVIYRYFLHHKVLISKDNHISYDGNGIYTKRRIRKLDNFTPAEKVIKKYNNSYKTKNDIK